MRFWACEILTTESQARDCWWHARGLALINFLWYKWRCDDFNIWLWWFGWFAGVGQMGCEFLGQRVPKPSQEELYKCIIYCKYNIIYTQLQHIKRHWNIATLTHDPHSSPRTLARYARRQAVSGWGGGIEMVIPTRVVNYGVDSFNSVTSLNARHAVRAWRVWTSTSTRVWAYIPLTSSASHASIIQRQSST